MISSQMWEEINKFYLMVRERARPTSEFRLACSISSTRSSLAAHLLQGVADADDVARRGLALRPHRAVCIERADKTSRILDVKYLPAAADVGRRGHAARHDSMGRAAEERPAPWKCTASSTAASRRPRWPTS